MFRAFGPVLLCRNRHRPADFGRILFYDHSTRARYLAVASTSAPARVAKFMHLHWRLPRPEVIISVNGGTQQFELEDRVKLFFEHGLVAVANATKALITTGGTDVGVIRLVGNALAKHGCRCPVVGMAPWRCIYSRQRLEVEGSRQAHGKEALYGGVPPPSGNGAPLNPHHTHFVLVDDGSPEGDPPPWGSECELAAAVERSYSQLMGVPIVQLLVQGGPGALKAVVDTARADIPIVVMAESGGAATALFEYFSGGVAAVHGAFLEKGGEAVLAYLRDIKQIDKERNGTLITFARADDADMSKMMLRAIVLHMSERKTKESGAKETGSKETCSAKLISAPSSLSVRRPRPYAGRLNSAMCAVGGKSNYTDRLAAALILAVNWDRVDVGMPILAKLGELAEHNIAGANDAFHAGLLRALELQRVAFIQELLQQPRIELWRLDMVNLFIMRDKYGFLSRNQTLQAGIRKYLHQQSTDNNGRGRRRGQSLEQEAAGAEGSEGNCTQAEKALMYNRYMRAVLPLLRAVSRTLALIAMHFEEVTMHDLFFWATLSGHTELTVLLWRHVDFPVHSALLAAYINTYLATQLQVVPLQKEVMKMATTMEQWALGTLNEIPHTDIAHSLLLSRMGTGGPSLLEMAMHLDMKNFLAHHHSEALIDLLWRSGPNLQIERVLWRHIAWQVVLPFASRTVRQALRAQTTEKAQASRGHHMLLEALARAMLVSYSERQRAPVSASTPDESPVSMGAALVGDVDGFYTPTREGTTRNSGPGDLNSSGKSLKDHLHASPGKRRQRGSLQAARRMFGMREPSQHEHSQHDHRHSVNPFDMASELNGADAANERGPSLLQLIGEFYSVPAVKFMVRLYVQLTILFYNVGMIAFSDTHYELEALQKATIATQGRNPPLPSITAWEYMSMMFVLSTALDREGVRFNVFSAHEGSVRVREAPIFWYVYDVYHVFISVAFGLRMASAFGFDYNLRLQFYSAYLIALSLALMTACLCCLPYLAGLSKPLGVLIIAFTEMVAAIGAFMVFTMFLIASFCLLFFGFEYGNVYQVQYDRGYLEDYEGYYGPPLGVKDSRNLTDDFMYYSKPWMIPFHGFFGPAKINVWDFRGPSVLLVIIYMFLTNMVLRSLVTAIFATAHNRVFQNSEIEYVYQKCKRCFYYKDSLPTVPPPFNVLWTAFLLVRHCYRELRFLLLDPNVGLFERAKSRLNGLQAKPATAGAATTTTASGREKRRVSEVLPAMNRGERVTGPNRRNDDEDELFEQLTSGQTPAAIAHTRAVLAGTARRASAVQLDRPAAVQTAAAATEDAGGTRRQVSRVQMTSALYRDQYLRREQRQREESLTARLAKVERAISGLSSSRRQDHVDIMSRINTLADGFSDFTADGAEGSPFARAART